MSTPEQRKRFKEYYRASDEAFEEWGKRDYCYPSPVYPEFPEDLRDLRCGAKTRAGTPCKLKALYASGRCKFHGGLSTGPKTKEGKSKVAKNGFKRSSNKQTP